jgi:hypothetical protein
VADEQDRLTETKWPFKHQLKKPIPGKDGDDAISLELREPTLGDMLEFGVLDGDINGEKMINLIAKLSEVSKVSVKLMHPKDYFAIQKVVTSFFTAAMA